MLLPPTQGEQPHSCSQTHSSGRHGYLLLSECWRRHMEKYNPWKHHFKLSEEALLWWHLCCPAH